MAKSERYLNYVDLKRELEARRRELVGRQNDHIREQVSQFDRSRSDRDEMCQVEDVDRKILMLDHATLREIDEALQRLHDGTYGDCADCGGEISDQRLRHMPFAALCKECKEGREDQTAREERKERTKPPMQFFIDMSA